MLLSPNSRLTLVTKMKSHHCSITGVIVLSKHWTCFPCHLYMLQEDLLSFSSSATLITASQMLLALWWKSPSIMDGGLSLIKTLEFWMGVGRSCLYLLVLDQRHFIHLLGDEHLWLGSDSIFSVSMCGTYITVLVTHNSSWEAVAQNNLNTVYPLFLWGKTCWNELHNVSNVWICEV